MTQERGEQTHQTIIRAAARLFALHGYYPTSMGDILEAVGLSKGAFYYHFKGKEQLALAVIRQLRADYDEHLFEPVRQLRSPAARLREMFDRLRRLHESGSWCQCLLLARLVLDTAQQRDELARQVALMVRHFTERWETLLTDARAAGVIGSSIHARDQAEFLAAAWLGAIIMREHNPQISLAGVLSILQSTLGL